MNPRKLIALLVILIATGAAAGEDLPGLYESKEHGFTVRYPQGWLFTETAVPPGGFRALFGDPARPGVGILVETRSANSVASPEAAREQEIQAIRGRADIKSPSPFTATVAGLTAPGLELLMTKDGKTYRVRRLYLIHHGHVVVFQWYAPAGDLDRHAKMLDLIRESFRLIRPVEPDPLRALAARCGSELDWARSWAVAAATAKKERRAVLVYVRRLGGFAISDPAMAGLFMDADVVALIESRFVPLVLRPDDPAPFLSHDVYGLSPSTFGSALLIVSPEGRVLATSGLLETFAAFTFMRETLLRHLALDGAPVGFPIRPVPLARTLLRRGEDEKALAAIEKDQSADAHRIRASIHRRRREGQKALAALDAARKAGMPEYEMLVDRSRVLLRMGRFEEAIGCLQKIPKENYLWPKAALWLGVLAFRANRVLAAKRVWKELVRDHPESRWAWRAAALLKSTSVTLGVQGRLRWPSDAFIAELTHPVAEARPVREAARANREALEALLRLQRDDGSWVCPVMIARAEGERPHEFTIGVTALCAASLLPRRDEPRVLAALRKADEWLRAAHEVWKTDPPPVLYMDYTVWSLAAHLRFLAQAVGCGFLPKKTSQKLAAEVLSDLLERQRPGGGFSYYVSQNPGRGEPDTRAISFVTAYVALALLDARDAGIPVPDASARRCLDALQAMLNPNGTFSYMKAGGVRVPDATKEPGAAGRGPYCALALQRGGRADLDLVRKTLGLFSKHRRHLGRERRKSLMHTGADGQGSHYIMFDYGMIAEAIAALPEAERSGPRALLLEEILATRLTDGSYVDNPFLGRSFGAAMALSAFDRLGVSR